MFVADSLLFVAIGGENIRKVKEKPSISKSTKEKARAAPKELLRRGLLTGAEKLKDQLRDAAEGGKREDNELNRAQGATWSAARQAAYRLGKLTPQKGKFQAGRMETRADQAEGRSDLPASDIQTRQDTPSDSPEPVRIKTRDTARQVSPAVQTPANPVNPDLSKIKTRDAYARHQAVDMGHSPIVREAVQPERQMVSAPDRSRPKFVRERMRTVPTERVTGQRGMGLSSTSAVQEMYSSIPRQRMGAADRAPIGEPDQQTPSFLEQGRQKFVQERQKKAKAQQRASYGGADHTPSMRQAHGGDIRPRHVLAPSVQEEKQVLQHGAQESISKRKHQIKGTRSGVVPGGCAPRQAIKTADSPRQAAQTGGHSVQVARQMAQATVQVQRRAVQAAGAIRETTTTVGRSVATITASALRGAVSAIRAMMAPLAAGGGAVIAIVLVLCLVGALLLSPLGILFSGEENGGQTISAVVREINQEYDAKVEELKTSATYDELSLSGSRATWPEILAVYAVKTTSDPTNGQEVVTMNDEKNELLKQVFWDMNQLSSFTSTVPGEGDEEGTTALYITVTAKTAEEMADVYGFNQDHRKMLTELLSEEYRDLWSAVLYGIGTGTGSGEIVAVALSQVGNVGGQPYWSWYGFGSRVNWCAIFVSWCANECGYIDAGVIPKFAGCVQGSRWFKERGLWQDRSYTPNPGDIIFFDWNDPGGFSGPQDGVPDHVGIVERVENGRVYTVEGNSGDKCCQRSYPVGYYEIYGYGILNFGF